jgi:hypothetical protein
MASLPFAFTPFLQAPEGTVPFFYGLLDGKDVWNADFRQVQLIWTRFQLRGR